MNLTDRIAKCTCGKQEPSNPNLAFFTYRGEGSRDATVSCGDCGYHDTAHQRARELREPHLKGLLDHEFTPRGAWEFDLFYCGCRGWD